MSETSVPPPRLATGPLSLPPNPMQSAIAFSMVASTSSRISRTVSRLGPADCMGLGGSDNGPVASRGGGEDVSDMA